MSRIDVLGVLFDDISMDTAVNTALDAIERRTGEYVVTPNPEIVMLARETTQLQETLSNAVLVLPDGIGIIHGAKILGTPLTERIPGIDFAANVIQKLAERQGSIYLLGAKPGVAEKAAENLEKKFPGLRIAGTHDGYFDDDSHIVEEINRVKPDFLLVCLGVPKQEYWMREHSYLDVGLMAGLGGSLDVFAGEVRRAPKIWQKLGLEWLYRLLKEPRRIGRMMKLPQFLLCVISERVRK